jgi:flagellar FliL protein
MASDASLLQLAGPTKSGMKGTVLWLCAMIGLTVFAGGAGGFIGLRLIRAATQNADVAVKPEAAATSKYSGSANFRELPPIITNLADPPTAWVRLQVALVFDGDAKDIPATMASEITEDLLGFMKTLSIEQIGGASGLQHLREDLNERAQIRSDGKVSELVIETLVVQ